MGKYLIEEQTLVDIADAIREKTGETDNIAVNKMSNKIQAITTGVGDIELQEQAELISEIQTTLQNKMYDSFLDEWQQYGSRTNYDHGFGGIGWNNTNFRPKYNIVPNTAYMMFRNSNIKEIFDTCDALNITIDTSKATNLQYAFQSNYTTRAGVIDMSRCTNSNYLFYTASYKTVDKIILSNTTVLNQYTFSSMINLENITFEGPIRQTTALTSKKLTEASLRSIVNALSLDVTGQTISLSTTAITNAFGGTTSAAWNELTNSKSNWSFAYTA